MLVQTTFIILRDSLLLLDSLRARVVASLRIDSTRFEIILSILSLNLQLLLVLEVVLPLLLILNLGEELQVASSDLIRSHLFLEGWEVLLLLLLELN